LPAILAAVTGRSHLLLTAGAYLALALHPVETPVGTLALPRLAAGALRVPGLDLVVGAVVAAACGLAPDADSAGSQAARAGGLPTRLAARLLQLALGHRGPLHSLAAAALAWWVGLVLGLALEVEGLAGVTAFGWGFHLLLDALTPRGVPLLWPLPLRFRVPPGLVTGGLAEQVVVLVALLLCGWWIGAK
jgi:inner membrane protein